MDLQERVAVVTGGGNGIGRALSLAFAAAGCDVAVAEEVCAHGRRAIATGTDVTSDAAVDELVTRTHDELGGAHVVCANAGVLLHGPAAQMNVQDWQWLVGVNLIGAVRTIHAFLPHLLEQGEGHLVITSSVTAIKGGGIYGASRAALLHLAETLHEEVGPQGVGTSVLLPAHIGSRINSSQRNRPPEFGRHVDEPYATLTEFGIDARHVARLAVEAVEAGELYVPVFPDGQQQRYTAPLKARMEALHEAAIKGGVRP